MSGRSAAALAVLTALGVALLAVGLAGAQQESMDGRSMIGKAEIAINWMKSALRSQTQDLESARRAKDTKTINCIEDRIVEMQAAITDSEKSLERLKDHAFRKAIEPASQEFDRIERNREKVQEQLELISKCREMIATGESFTEVTEEFSGDEGEDPTEEEETSGAPVPVPPSFDDDEEPPTPDEPGEGDGEEG